MHGKYGRVFTEADVRALLHCAHAGSTDLVALSAAAAEKGKPMTFPADEPVFVLRAQDEVAMAGLMGYDEGLFSLDVHPDEPHRRGVGEMIRAFEEFERAHPDRMGRPD